MQLFLACLLVKFISWKRCYQIPPYFGYETRIIKINSHMFHSLYFSTPFYVTSTPMQHVKYSPLLFKFSPLSLFSISSCLPTISLVILSFYLIHFLYDQIYFMICFILLSFALYTRSTWIPWVYCLRCWPRSGDSEF